MDEDDKENPFSSPLVLSENLKKTQIGDEKKLNIPAGQQQHNLCEKCLTTSDDLHRLVVTANKDACKYFPLATVFRSTDNFLQLEDEEGKPWMFEFSYLKVSQIYEFTEAWSSYVKEKQLGIGDFVFIQRHRTVSSRLSIDFRRRNNSLLYENPAPLTMSIGDGGSALQSDNFQCHDPAPSTISFMDGDAPLQLTPPFQSDNFPCHDPAPSTMSFEDGGAALQLHPCQDPFPCHDLAPPTISSGDGGAAPRDCIYLLPDSVTSSETLEQPRVSGYSITGVDPILVISCGYNQSSEERYFISYIFNELRLRGFAPLGYDLSRSPVNGNQDLLDKSQLGIIIFSMNYVSSRECMDGFVALMDHSKANELMLFPVFFEVEFCNVKDQAGSFEKAFAQFENSVQASQVLKWKAAVKELTSTDRYHQYKKGDEVMLAKNIVRDVQVNSKTGSNLTDSLQLSYILSLLNSSQSSAPHIVGLWGMAGIGKTTFSREIFRTQGERYDVCYFLPDFHQLCQTKGLNPLREEFLSKIFGEEKVFIDPCGTKLSFTRDRFRDKKVLIVLDGVSNARDAEVLVGGFGWFSGGHTIILTSRNRQVLIKKLSESDSIRLCRQFATEKNWKVRMSLIEELVNYASGNPLALRALCSSIQKQCISGEEEHLSILHHPTIEIRDAFGGIFRELDDNEKNTFLDLACFFKGENKDHVVNILDGCGFLTDLGISGLIDESLISLVDNRIEMPNIFQDMGRFVVRQEHEEAGKRSRLSDSSDIVDVLTNNSGTEIIEGIFLNASGLKLKLSSNVFEEMDRLRLLKLHYPTSENDCKVSLPEGLLSLPDELRLLHWERYPLESLPGNFNPENLVELNMPYSNLTKLWEGTESLEMLKRIILSHSRQLTDFSWLSMATNLEHIDLEGCTSLVEVNSSSILHHRKLTFLSLKDCSHLRIIPNTAHLESLEVLNLSGCSELEHLEDFSPNLTKIYLAGTAIKEIPSSVVALTRLVTLDVGNCNRLQHLPPEINLKAVVGFTPSQPGQPVCTSYFHTGICSKGPACSSDHPTLSTHKNTSSIASETQVHVELIRALTHENPSSNNLEEVSTKKPRIHRTTSFVTSGTLDLNQQEIGFSFFNQPESSSPLGASLNRVDAASVMTDLEDKCFLNVSYNRLEMHDLLYTMGKEIGYESSVEREGKRPRLWNHKYIRHVLDESTGTGCVRGIFLNMSNVERIKLSPDVFMKMSNLKFLKFHYSHCSQWCDNKHKFQFSKDLDHFPDELVYLHWQGYPYEYLPSEFNPEELVDLSLRHSYIKQLWEDEKNTEKLRWVDLSQSQGLLNLSGLSRAKNLERLDLEGCKSLVMLGSSIEQMNKLIYLNLRECTSLESLPEGINLKSLKTLILSGCSNLQEFQIISENIESLYLDGSTIQRVAERIESLRNLILLNLKNCCRLKCLPNDLYKLKSLQELILSGCSALESLPPIKEEMGCLEILLMDGTSIKQTPETIFLSNLKVFSFCGSSIEDSTELALLPFSGNSCLSDLYLTNCNIYKLPDNFSSLHSLRSLCLSRNNIETLPESIEKLHCLLFLDLKHCRRLNSLPVLPPNIQYVDAHGCVSLEKVAKPVTVPLVTERMHTTFIFTDCFKLNRAEQEAIVAQAQLKSQLLARTSLQHNHKGLVLDPLVAVCFPGSDIPSWFCHQSMGSSIETNLLPHWCNNKFIGASLGVVVTFKDHEGNESCGSSCHEPRKLGSDHVFISFNNCNVPVFQWNEEINDGNRCRPTSASFEFYLTDGTERKLERCKVTRCGMSLLYAPDENDRGFQGTRVTDTVERTSSEAFVPIRGRSHSQVGERRNGRMRDEIPL
ncbi:hypothetical protein Bca52824_038087 [Brassica carinata]|uniref:ADP-ribosyl cyclase/cyclic ADP-ribose hydrolase n=1 Tax=Brassica carinata TaxID=52824 RepID=A0A8X7RNY5_BRACI|nr:hypothetical protein Bca52824_038087 [Brassica carinata]